ATQLRYSDTAVVPWRNAMFVALGLAAVYLAVGVALRLHQGRAKTGSMEDMLLVGMVAAFSGAVVSLVNAPHLWVGRSVPVAAVITFVVLAGLGRAVWRAYAERPVAQAPEAADAAVRALIAGAGDAGHDLVVSMLRDPARAWVPVGFVDDDRAK